MVVIKFFWLLKHLGQTNYFGRKDHCQVARARTTRETVYLFLVFKIYI